MPFNPVCQCVCVRLVVCSLYKVKLMSVITLCAVQCNSMVTPSMFQDIVYIYGTLLVVKRCDLLSKGGGGGANMF